MKERPTIQQEQPGLTFGEVGRELGRRWKTLDESARKPFTAQAEQDALRHANEMAAYMQRTPQNSGFVSSQSSHPTGWGLNQTHVQPTQQKKPRPADSNAAVEDLGEITAMARECEVERATLEGRSEGHADEFEEGEG